jgi:hypothetical protein
MGNWSHVCEETLRNFAMKEKYRSNNSSCWWCKVKGVLRNCRVLECACMKGTKRMTMEVEH